MSQDGAGSHAIDTASSNTSQLYHTCAQCMYTSDELIRHMYIIIISPFPFPLLTLILSHLTPIPIPLHPLLSFLPLPPSLPPSLPPYIIHLITAPGPATEMAPPTQMEERKGLALWSPVGPHSSSEGRTLPWRWGCCGGQSVHDNAV